MSQTRKAFIPSDHNISIKKKILWKFNCHDTCVNLCAAFLKLFFVLIDAINILTDIFMNYLHRNKFRMQRDFYHFFSFKLVTPSNISESRKLFYSKSFIFYHFLYRKVNIFYYQWRAVFTWRIQFITVSFLILKQTEMRWICILKLI